jgi:hypothetical protein
VDNFRKKGLLDDWREGDVQEFAVPYFCLANSLLDKELTFFYYSNIW